MDMNEIMRWYNQQRAAGKVIQPWEVEAAYKSAMDVDASKALQGRKLALAQAGLEEQKRMNTQKIGMDQELLRQQDLDRQASIKAGKYRLGGQLGSAAMLYGFS